MREVPGPGCWLVELGGSFTGAILRIHPSVYPAPCHAVPQSENPCLNCQLLPFRSRSVVQMSAPRPGGGGRPPTLIISDDALTRCAQTKAVLDSSSSSSSRMEICPSTASFPPSLPPSFNVWERFLFGLWRTRSTYFLPLPPAHARKLLRLFLPADIGAARWIKLENAEQRF